MKSQRIPAATRWMQPFGVSILLIGTIASGTVSAQLGPPPAVFFRPAPNTEALYPADAVYPRGRIFPFSFFSSGGGHAAEDAEVEAAMDRLHAAGIPLLGPQYEFNARVLDDARRRGMRAVYAVGISKDHLRKDQLPMEEAMALIREQVAAAAGDDTVAWWYLQPEELRHWRPDEKHYLIRAVEVIRATDPRRRPIWMYEPGHRDARNMAPLARHLDIIGKGMYTNYSGMRDSRAWCRWTIEQQIEAIAASGSAAIPIAVPEMFREPEPDQVDRIADWVRHDAYLALVSGARGIVVFSARVRPNFPSHPAYYAAWEQVARELCGPEGLGRVFLFGERRDGLELDIYEGPDRVQTRLLRRSEETVSYPSVHFADIAYGTARYLFAVNSSNEPVSAMVGGLPYGRTRVKDLFEDLPGYLVPEGDFSVEFGPLEVKAFRITYDDLEPAAPGPAGRLAERGYRVSAEEFMRAAREGDVNTLALFREAGLDVNIRCPGETTALMWAAGEGHREAVDWLLANGASLHVADPDFWTPLLWAERGGHEDIAEQFRAAGLTEQRLFP